MAEPFTHLRVASGYSLQYGASHPSVLVGAAAGYDMDTLALTDRDGLYGAVRFAKACLASGIAPVVGVDLAVADASFLALSPGADGTWSLTAGAVRKARLRAAPVVVLAACRAAVVAPFQHARWSLPDAFLAAGARAVIAPAVDIPDAEAGPFFDQIRARILGGEAPAVAVAAVRAAAVARGQAWAASVVVFE